MTTRVVVLAYNEEANISDALHGIRSAKVPDLEIVVVNDGSTDRTGTILDNLKAAMNVHVLTHEINRGVAAAFDTGLRHAAAVSTPGDLVITMEADGTSDSTLLPSLVALLEAGHDVAIASRYARGGAYESFPVGRYVCSVGANAIMRLYCRLPSVKDYTIFYRGYRAEVLQQALGHYGHLFIEARGFFANIEILVKLSRLRPLRAAETPLVYRYGAKRSRSKMGVWRNIREYIRFFVREARGRGTR
jgi:dolichol-phosphate mannosyltransferase